MTTSIPKDAMQTSKRRSSELASALDAGSPTDGNARILPPPPEVWTGVDEAMDGWGFKDTYFVAAPEGHVMLTGTRYNISNVELPFLLPWMRQKLDAPLAHDDVHERSTPTVAPPSRASQELVRELSEFLSPSQISDDPVVRQRRGHGHGAAEIWAVRYGQLRRVPDLVVFPSSVADVERLVTAAERHSVCLIPFGGGTNASEALRVPASEERSVIAVDMRRMNRILWIDPVSRTARIEAGALGRVITKELARYDLTLGHEPDSVEFSTLGGWISTNASGMKRGRYGNIEDIVLDVDVVTPAGVVSRQQVGPRESIGVDPKELMFGSEGNYGIITSAVVQLRAVAEVKRYGSLLFPSLRHGLEFVYDLTQVGALPASVRVMDSTQFQMGQALKPRKRAFLAHAKSRLEKWWVTRFKGFDPERLAAATLIFEGSAAEVAFQERALYRAARAHGGMRTGAVNGERGYQLTFGIAYIRDFAFKHWIIAESFETSVPWGRALELYERVGRRLILEHKTRQLPGKLFFSGRITQVYQTGVCVYFYYGFYAKGVTEPVRQSAEMEHAARQEILDAGGSLSHHHGVGKLRQDFLPQVYSEGSLAISRRVKQALDPQNLFGASNHGVNGYVR